MWRRQFEWYLKATKKTEADEEILVGIFLTLFGVDGLRIYDTFTFATRADAKKIKPVLDLFDYHFEPRRSEVFERFKFLRRHQQTGESFTAWLVDLRNLVKSCNYRNIASVEAIFRDQIVMGVAYPLVREKLLFEQNLLLAKSCDIVRACESSKAQITQIGVSPDTGSVHRILTDIPPTRPDQPSRSSAAAQSNTCRFLNSSSSGQQQSNCNVCGRRHQKNQCRAVRKAKKQFLR